MKLMRKLIGGISAYVLCGGPLLAIAQGPPAPPTDNPVLSEPVSRGSTYPSTGYFPPIPYQSSSDYPTAGAYDVVGSELGQPLPPGRPLYPYGRPYWEAQDSEVEDWGDLLEIPNVTPGWFAHTDATLAKAHINTKMNSASLLDNTFLGNPVTLGAADLDSSIMGKLTVGRRWEHGLGEIQFGAKSFDYTGAETLAAFDPGGPTRLASVIRGNTLDLDFCYLEFNAEGLPLIPPMAKNPGRLGLGKPLTPGYLAPPLEIRWLFGFRYSNIYYESLAVGPTLSERVMNTSWGAGLHFAVELNQRIPVEAPIFAHFRFEGSGVFGSSTQSYYRNDNGVADSGTMKGNLGYPTVDVEVGMSWVPKWPCRDMRATLAYHYEEWYTFADVETSNLYLTMHGILVRMELRF